LVATPAALNGLPALSAPHSAPAQAYYVTSSAAIPALGFTLTQPFSIFLVIKRQATTGTQKADEFLIGNNNSAAFSGWSLMVGSAFTNTLHFDFVGTTGTSLHAHGSTALVTGTAYGITVTYDGSGSAAGIQIYVNGVAETMTVITNTATGATTNLPLVIGGGAANANFYDADFVCEAAIANAKLTSTQIGYLNTYAVQKWAA
jgi:hypothetical protein